MSALVGGVRVLLVVVEVAAAGFAVAGAGAVAVGALAVPVCGAAVARCLVHGSYCVICVRACLRGWTRGWLAGWLVVPRAARCLSVSARGGCLWATGWGGGVLGVLWARGRVGAPPPFWWVCGWRPASARVYVRFVGGLGMWRVWPSWRSRSASRAVMTRPQMGGHASAYLLPAHTARSWAASWGADTGCVVRTLSGLVCPSVVSSAAGPMAAAQRWVSSASVAAMLLMARSPRYVSPVAVVSPWPSPACFRFR